MVEAELDEHLARQRLTRIREASAEQAVQLARRSQERLPSRAVRRAATKQVVRASAAAGGNVVTDPFLGVKILFNRYLDWVMVAHLRIDGRRDKAPEAPHHDRLSETWRRNMAISAAGAGVIGAIVAVDLLIYPDANPVVWAMGGAAVFGCWLRGHVTRRGEFRAPSPSGVPDEDTLTSVFQAAGVLRAPTTNNGGNVTKSGQALRLITKDFHGHKWTATVEFPAGISADQARKKHAEIASALGASVDTVFITLPRGHAGRCRAGTPGG